MAALHESLLANQCRLEPIQLFPLPFDTVVGEVREALPQVSAELSRYACRNARLALFALSRGDFRARVEAAVARHGSDRVGVILGTSTSGIYDSEAAYVQLLLEGRMPEDFNFMHRHAAQATAEFVQKELKLGGPCYAISTACSSSAKALGAAQRLIGAGICDAILVAGVDTLCRLTLRGFHSLELISSASSKPMDRKRRGINIGEAAALLLLEKTGPRHADRPHLLAVGESSDAHHMSAPHPEGAGAALAMERALSLGGVAADAVGYVNLHATASPLNDLAEAKAIDRVFPMGVPCSGVKGLLGHTLGAAGAIEAVVSLLALERGFLPGTCGLSDPDPACTIDLLTTPRQGVRPAYVMSNSFGFGGNNASVLFRAAGVA